MLLGSIRTRLLGLVLATVVPFTALIGAGLWGQWQTDHAAAFERATNEARLLAAQVDDHISNLDNLLVGLSRAVSWDPAETHANDALLRKVRSELPDFVANILVFSLDGTKIGASTDVERGPSRDANDRDYIHQIVAGHSRTIGAAFYSRVIEKWVVPVAHAVIFSAAALMIA